MVDRLPELVDLADSEDEDSTAPAFFKDSSENIKTDSSSEADVKDVGHALADIYADDDSDFRSGYYRPKYLDHQACGSSSTTFHT